MSLAATLPELHFSPVSVGGGQLVEAGALLLGWRAKDVGLGIERNNLGHNLSPCLLVFWGILCFSPEVEGRKQPLT